MRCRILTLFLCFIAAIASAHVQKSSSRTLDPSYSSALAAANRFLHAWQTEDHETGIVMLTDWARQHASAEQLQKFFSPGPDAAYEIARGKRVNSGAYAFPVVLFGADAPASRPVSGTIILVRSGNDEWSVERLP